jgi:hypothetical protein
MEALMSNFNRISVATLALIGLAACGPSKEHARADSAAVLAANDQLRLSKLLTAQKDSLTRVVLQADDFIMKIDSTVTKALPKGKTKKGTLDPLAQQLENRKAVMVRVDALVKRARETQQLLAKSQKDNVALREQLAADSAMITDLNSTIQRQTATISALSTRVDSLNGVTRALGATIADLEAQHNKAFYVIGREDDLVQRGIVVREGGANLLIAHPGRTLQMSRTVDPNVFTAVDQRGTHMIAMPDSSRRYRVVSRQSLDYAAVDNRDNESFTGNLKISEPTRFWAPSRFLIIVEQ